MSKIKKILLPLLWIGVFVALSYMLLQFAGAFFLGYRTLSGEMMPEKWQEKEVSIIAYNQYSVDYTWTGGVLGRRGILVTEENGNLRIVAQISPEESSIILYP